MKKGGKNGRLRVFRWLACGLIIASGFFASCGGTTGAPPVPITAPTGGYLNITAPDSGSDSLTYGQIVTGSGADLSAPKSVSKDIMFAETPHPNVAVRVTNSNTGVYADTTTDANARFAVDIAATVADTVKVKYQDETTGEWSEETSLTVTTWTQKIPTATMTPQDVSVDTDSGLAYMVANDGTDSQIIVVDLSTGAINNTFSHTSRVYKKIAVHSTLNYAAILDQTNSTLYWCDLAEGVSCESKAIVSTPNDVAVTDGATTTRDMIIVGNDYAEAPTYSSFTIYPINVVTAPTLGTVSRYCMRSPSDPAANKISCTDRAYVPNPNLTATTHIGLIVTGGQPKLASLVEYDDSTTAAHMSYFSDTKAAGDPITMIGTGLISTNITATITPYDFGWYNSVTALLTDTTNNTLVPFDDNQAGTLTEGTALAVGTSPAGIFSDSANERAFVAVQGGDEIVNVNMDTFELSGTTYTALFDPTYLVYYTDGTVHSLGVILTSPQDLFYTIDISP